MMPADVRPTPRWALSGLALGHASVFLWGAVVIPWQRFSLVSVSLAIAAASYLTLAVLAARGKPPFSRVWRAVSWASLAGLGVLIGLTLDAAFYLQALYGSLGEGIGVALAVAVAPVALLTLPISLWGLAVTGGVSTRARVSVIAIIVLSVFTLAFQARARAAVSPVPGPDISSIRFPLPDSDSVDTRAPVPYPGPTLYSPVPLDCAQDPAARGGRDQATVFLAFVSIAEGRIEPRLRCLQAPPEQMSDRIGQILTEGSFRLPVKIDVVTGVSRLRPSRLPIDMLALRPGLDGVCHRGRCLTPWQLVGANHFVRFQPLPFIPDLRLGVSGNALGVSLGRAEPSQAGVEGLTRVETESWLLTKGGELIRLHRLRPEVAELDAPRLEQARRAAESYILDSQDGSGIFRYVLDPYTGGEYVQDFVLPRQAGTTLGLCETLDTDPRRGEASRRSLRAMGEWERVIGDMGALVKPADAVSAHLGDTALPLIAFIACRDQLARNTADIAGLDETIGRMGRWLARMQRPDGSFYPSFDLLTGAPEQGPDPLYAAGQAIYALSSLERLAQSEPHIAEPSRVSEVVDRAMEYFSESYWDRRLLRLFFVEENWHCLAAKASLEHHRHDGYERFCLDYMEFKKRFILDENSRVAEAFIGGHGFGNLLPPHNTPTAGLGETLAAAMAIKQARGEPLGEDRVVLDKILHYLVRQQWSDAACFACDGRKLALGAFSESIASPVVRIDYVQHALSALTHGAPFLADRSDLR